MSLITSSPPRLRMLAAAAALSMSFMAPASAAESIDSAPANIALTQSTPQRGHEIQSSNSGTAWFPNGQPITANAWIQTIAKGGCGNFSTSVIMNVSPSSITNNTSFYQWGVQSISLGPLNIESSRTGPRSLKWTNNNGARGSYLSGTVCGGWGTLYTGVKVEGSAFYNGTTRHVATRI